MSASPIALGNDLIEIERIRRTLATYGPRFLARVFTEKEQVNGFVRRDPAPYFAGRFAAKEAIAKALGTGIGSSLSWLDLEILSDPSGKPCVYFPQQFQLPAGRQVVISISHCRAYALATAIIQKVS